MNLDDLIRALEKAGEESGDLAPVFLQDEFGGVYEVKAVEASEDGVWLVPKDNGHFS